MAKIHLELSQEDVEKIVMDHIRKSYRLGKSQLSIKWDIPIDDLSGVMCAISTPEVDKSDQISFNVDDED